MKQPNLAESLARQRARELPGPDPRPIIREFPVSTWAKQYVSEAVQDWRVREGLWQLNWYDSDTYRHVIQTGLLATHLGGRAELKGEQLRYLAMGAIMHDVGKTALDVGIINSGRKLNDKEYAAIQQHPETGYRITGNLFRFDADERRRRLVPQLVLTHHCYNAGRNPYPDARAMGSLEVEGLLRTAELQDPELTRLGEILAISDVYEAITAGRTYAANEGFEDVRRVEAVLQQSHPVMEAEIDELMAVHAVRFALAEAA